MEIKISLNATAVTRTSLWNELQKRKKNGKVDQSVLNAAIKALNADAQSIVKKANDSGITAARAVSNLIRSVSSVESTSGSVTRTAMWNELQKRKKNGKIEGAKFNAAMKALNTDAQSIVKKANDKGLSAARAVSDLVRSVSSVESTSADVTRTAIWNELQKRKKNGKIEQSVFNAAMKALNADAQGIVKKAKASGITAARATSNLIRSVSAVESTSGATGQGIRLYLQKRVAAGVITAAQMQNVLDWITKHPMEFRQAAKQYNSDGIGASRIFNRVNGKTLPPLPKG